MQHLNGTRANHDSPHPHTHPRRGLRGGCSAGELLLGSVFYRATALAEVCAKSLRTSSRVGGILRSVSHRLEAFRQPSGALLKKCREEELFPIVLSGGTLGAVFAEGVSGGLEAPQFVYI